MAHLLKSQLDSVNMVNALSVAESRGVDVSVTTSGSSKDFRSLITVKVIKESREQVVAGTLFTGKEPRIVNIEGVPIEAALAPHMLYIRNIDKPGMIGGMGTILAESGQNIADFRLGRQTAAGTAVALVSLDAELPEDVFEKLKALPQIERIKQLRF
jgi:D-3-phosphoglycerate dehydrogenase